MTNPEMGLKRQCLSCAAKFFDLSKDPIKCPKCGATFEPVVLARSPPRRIGRPFAASRPFEGQSGAVTEAEVEAPAADEQDEDDGEENPALVANEA